MDSDDACVSKNNRQPVTENLSAPLLLRIVAIVNCQSMGRKSFIAQILRQDSGWSENIPDMLRVNAAAPETNPTHQRYDSNIAMRGF